ncbi:HlyD family efflux transporter periplasmic adaptor subunit [Hymenobacter sp. BT664]|uniref:HlyD family efflux transporter periplasmic adaptor subunit n=1 Tax=Hymenobacter montanus TaxID=2771359 RepID=A0A927GJ92_9BACT|nr:HlyD family efflux transporter periplasmic adaptor subunit [Hymenobacter montanus]MBD2767876.1 HlyD family efflux transporter periplasmic adaptor subunit [Hymenobacter montanus]
MNAPSVSASALAPRLLLAIGLLASCQSEEPRFDASGNFETTEYVVAAKAQGQLLRLAVAEGDELPADREVGVIDTTQLYLRKRQLQASQQAVRQQTPNVSSQLGALAQQVANLQRERKRVVNLVKADAVPAKQLDDIDYQIAVARQQVAAQRSTLGTQASGTSAQVEPLRMQVQQVNDQLRNSRVVNPLAGTVLTVYVEPSEVVNYGQPLYKIGDTKTLILRSYVAGDQLTRVKLRQAVKVLVDAPGGKRREYPGQVQWIASKSEFTPKVIQTKEDRVNLVYALKIAVPNDGSLKIGMPADVLF